MRDRNLPNLLDLSSLTIHPRASLIFDTIFSDWPPAWNRIRTAYKFPSHKFLKFNWDKSRWEIILTDHILANNWFKGVLPAVIIRDNSISLKPSSHRVTTIKIILHGLIMKKSIPLGQSFLHKFPRKGKCFWWFMTGSPNSILTSSNSQLRVQDTGSGPVWHTAEVLVLGVHWKDWYWSWNSNTLATSWEELTHWKRLWCWEGLGAGGEGDDRGWDGWIASPTPCTWVWVNSRSWWWTGRPGVLQFMGSQRVGHDWATELNWTEGCVSHAFLRSKGRRGSWTGIAVEKRNKVK